MQAEALGDHTNLFPASMPREWLIFKRNQSRLGKLIDISLDRTAVPMKPYSDIRDGPWGLLDRTKQIEPGSRQQLHQVFGILKTENALFRQPLATISTTGQLLPSGEELVFCSGLDNNMGHLGFLRAIQSC